MSGIKLPSIFVSMDSVRVVDRTHTIYVGQDVASQT